MKKRQRATDELPMRELTREEEEKFAAWYREKHELEDDEEIDFDNFRVFDDTTVMTMSEKDYSGFILDVINLDEL